MKIQISMLLAFCVCLPVGAVAELTLEGLAKQCEGVEPKPSQPSVGFLMCISYIGGALDQIILTDGLAVQTGNQAKRTICGPDDGKVQKLSSLVKFAAKTQPEMLDKPARTILRGLVFGEFRCAG